MIPKRRRAELPAGHPMVIDEDEKTGRPIVILADWVPENRETEQRLVREAMRWWRSTKRSGLAVVPIGLAASAAWAGDQMKNPVVSAATATAVTATALVAFFPGGGHHAPNGVPRPPIAAPPATPVQPEPRPPKAAPVSHRNPAQGPALATTRAHSRIPNKPHKVAPKPHKAKVETVPVEPVVGKVPPIPSTPISKRPTPVPTLCRSKGLLGSQTTVGDLNLCL